MLLLLTIVLTDSHDDADDGDDSSDDGDNEEHVSVALSRDVP